MPSETIGTTKCVATRTGVLQAETVSEKKQQKLKVDVVPLNTSKYLHPQNNDIVLGIVVQRNAEFYLLDINAEAYAVLPVLEHQGATLRDRPKYEEGTLVYCRVLEASSASGLARTKLSCISPLCKKAWNTGEAFFGELKGGLVKEFPVGYCRGLLTSEDSILDLLGQKLKFNINIGFNGKLWVDARIADTILIMTCLERDVQGKPVQALLGL